MQARLIRGAIVSDTWYTLASGRAVVTHGLPRGDTLTLLTLGRQWVDQQWLAQAAIYGLWRLGNWQLALLCLLAVYALTFTLLARIGRRLGGSDRSVALVTVLCFVAGLPNTALRAQIPAYLLFALVLGLLLADERRPSRRVLLVFPLLAVWANVHGSVVLGAGLVTLRGLVLLWEPLRARTARAAPLARAASLIVRPGPACSPRPTASRSPATTAAFSTIRCSTTR